MTVSTPHRFTWIRIGAKRPGSSIGRRRQRDVPDQRDPQVLIEQAQAHDPECVRMLEDRVSPVIGKRVAA